MTNMHVISTHAWSRLPAVLKHPHGDAFVISSPEDRDLQNKMSHIVSQIGNLEDGRPPVVLNTGDICCFNTRHLISEPTADHRSEQIMRLEHRFEHYTLMLCVVTPNLLGIRSRDNSNGYNQYDSNNHIIQGLLASALAKDSNKCIPLFRNPDEFKTMLNNTEISGRFPELFNIVRPMYLDGGCSEELNTVRKLRRIFNCFLDKKLKRMDRQCRDIVQTTSKL